MQNTHRASLHAFRLVAPLALAALALLAPGCAHEGQVEGGSSPRVTLSNGSSDSSAQRSPSSVCDQYLAMLSQEAQQEARPRYGSGGECWSGGDTLGKQCETECRGHINRIIRANLEAKY